MQTTITEEDFQIKVGNISIYKCPGCGGYDVKDNYKFCPHCGSTLLFKV